MENRKQSENYKTKVQEIIRRQQAIVLDLEQIKMDLDAISQAISWAGKGIDLSLEIIQSPDDDIQELSDWRPNRYMLLVIYISLGLLFLAFLVLLLSNYNGG